MLTNKELARILMEHQSRIPTYADGRHGAPECMGCGGNLYTGDWPCVVVDLVEEVVRLRQAAAKRKSV